jgi:phospholipid-binding lipoprotein MlaA
MRKKFGMVIMGLALFIHFAAFSAVPAPEEPLMTGPDVREIPDSGEENSSLAIFVLAAVREEVPTEATPGGPSSSVAEGGSGGEVAVEGAEDSIPDPLEPINRAFFYFNDKFYFWLLKPIATGYKTVVPEPARVGIKNFFYNLAFPIRFINCILQGKVEGAANEFARFMVNSTFGLAGFLDVIPEDAKMKRYEEDLGQTLGTWGAGPGIYLNWPILGPSSLRDSLGLAGDFFLSPVNYLSQAKYVVATRSFDEVNKTSLRIGDYEDLIKASLDPYIALRNAYYQNRRSKILE